MLDRSAEVLEFYPDTQLALRLWNVYVTSVDPVVKILHIPTVQSSVLATVLDPRSASSSTVALTLAIYYAAVTALAHDNNHEPITLPADKSVLLQRYRMCLDRLLTVAELTSRPEIEALQALAIYAVSIENRHELSFGQFILLTRVNLDLSTGQRIRPKCMGAQWAGNPARSIYWTTPRRCKEPL